MITLNTVIFACSSAALIILTNWWRASIPKRRDKTELVPNCLITRFPIIFISGPRSPFYFKSYWNSLPYFLQEHGYVVEEWTLEGQSIEQRISDLQVAFKRRRRETFHLVIDQVENFNGIIDLCENTANVSTITYFNESNRNGTATIESSTSPKEIRPKEIRPKKIRPITIIASSKSLSPFFWLCKLTYELHRIWTGQRGAMKNQLALPGKDNRAEHCQYLKHFVKIAEEDYLAGLKPKFTPATQLQNQSLDHKMKSTKPSNPTNSAISADQIKPADSAESNPFLDQMAQAMKAPGSLDQTLHQ